MINNKGITLIALILTIIVMAIISSALVYTGINNTKIEKLQNINADIDAIKNAVNVYYLKNKTIPIEYDGSNKKILIIEQVIQALGENRKQEDSDIYYIIDLRLLENLTISGEAQKGTFIINSTTHNIYFINAEVMNTIGYITSVEAPTATHTLNPQEWSLSTEITVTVSGGVGAITIEKPDGSTVNGNIATYTVTANSDYLFKLKDSMGNTRGYVVEVRNIDKEGPIVTHILSPNPPAIGASVTITINATDTKSGVKSITKPDSVAVTGATTTYTVNANGTYTFKAKDNLDNETTYDVVVSNVDTTIYTDEDGKTAYVPDEFTPSTKPGETKIDEGLVVTGPDGSEFVWVPVPNPVLDVQGKNDTQINNAIKAEITAGRYPMAIKVTGGDYKGVLYDFSGTTIPAIVTPMTYTTSGTSYREPDVLTDASYGDSSYYLSTNGINLTQAQFKTQLQDEYNKMVVNVVQRLGFYIGRYETSLNGVNVQSKANIAPMVSINWYDIYQKQRLYVGNNNVAKMYSAMIYGSQWDQVMIWMKGIANQNASNKPYIVNSINMGWYSNNSGSVVHNTGTLVNAKVKNIFDMAGNVWDWTQEVNFTSGRVHRRS